MITVTKKWRYIQIIIGHTMSYIKTMNTNNSDHTIELLPENIIQLHKRTYNKQQQPNNEGDIQRINKITLV